MTDNSEREFLATQVMGWLDGPDDTWAIPSPGGAEGSDVQWDFISKSDFDPRNNIEWAILVFQTWAAQTVWTNETGMVTPYNLFELTKYQHNQHKQLIDAMIDTVLQAYNYEGRE